MFEISLCETQGGTALHPGKDLAVSLWFSYPYSQIEPSTLGSGSPDSCESRTSLLAPLSLRTTGVTRYPFRHPPTGGADGCPDFPLCIESSRCEELSLLNLGTLVIQSYCLNYLHQQF